MRVGEVMTPKVETVPGDEPAGRALARMRTSISRRGGHKGCAAHGRRTQHGMSRRKALAIGALALAAVTLPLHAEKPDVRARLIAPPSMPAGTRTVLVVELTLGPGWHVNSHTPSETFLVPTELTPATSAGTLSPVRYPPQVERHFAFSEKPLHVYDGTVRFETDLEVPATAVDGVSITGTLSYQACNEQQCFPPARLALSAVIAIANPRSATPTR